MAFVCCRRSGCRTAFTPVAATLRGGALASLTNEEVFVALGCHVRADCGALDDAGRCANERALVHGGRLFSANHSATGEKFWIWSCPGFVETTPRDRGT
jgi:hypothetical protein